ncbi:[weak similarity to] plasmid replication initiator protein RepA, partial [methanotrophic bacterial endosymbiont of Bathymodiolus sp.]
RLPAKITFKNRAKWWEDEKEIGGVLPPFPPLAFEEAKKVAPNYDVYYLERDFREWLSNIGKPAPDNLTKAFVGFCKARHKRKPHP